MDTKVIDKEVLRFFHVALLYYHDSRVKPFGEEGDLVAKSNELIDATYNLNRDALKLGLYMMSKVSRNDAKLKTYRIYIGEFISLLPGKRVDLYTTIWDLYKVLMNEVIDLPTETGRIMRPLIIKVESFEKKPYLEYQFHPELRSYIIALMDHFALYSITPLLGYKSKHSIRLYEILKAYEGVGYRTITTKNLYRMLGIEKQYPKFCNLKQRVLDVAQKELANSGGTSFTYRSIKKGRLVSGVKFTIKKY